MEIIHTWILQILYLELPKNWATTIGTKNFVK